MITRKIQLSPVGSKEEISRVYKYIRDAINVQNRAMNQYISTLYGATLCDATKEDRKELHNLYGRISSSKKGSAYDRSMEFQTGLPIGTISKAVEADFKKSLKDGLMYGRVSLPTYTNNNPLIVHVNYCNLRSKIKESTGMNTGIYHNYANHTEFLDHLYKKDVEIFLQFANKILFKLRLGDNVNKSMELRTVIQKIFEEEYTIHGSQIQLQKRKNGKGDDIYLLLSIETPQVEHRLDENTVVGVDLGVATPAVCALNNKWQPREYIGNGETFIAHKQKIKNQRKSLQKNLTTNTGGHGRNKKLNKLNKLKASESNFADSYSHKISKEIVDFALKHNAKYINIEDLTGIDTEHEKLLGLWKYYKTQQYITYKAAKHGIEVRKINPRYTSQICSKCGHWEEGQRNGRDFKCKACGEKMNADYNAARNIAMSTEFVKDKDVEEETA